MNHAEGKLLLVATPIGNLGDITLRAIETLRTVEWIYAEDTRHSAGLLNAHGIDAKGRLRSLHAHNEAQRCGEVIEIVRAGATVAYISDAGTPGVSDPGERLVAACAVAGITIESIPGASACISALVVSGLPTTPFCFMGFLERKGASRNAQLATIAQSSMTVVLYESPKRLAATLGDLRGTCGGARRAVVARELTKMFEQVERATLAELCIAIADATIPDRGECVILVAGRETGEATALDADSVSEEIAALLVAGMRSRDIADGIATKFGVARRDAYEMVLQQAKITGRR